MKRPLSIKRETLRRLTPDQLETAQGALRFTETWEPPTGACTNACTVGGCANSDLICNTFTVTPH